MNRARLGESRFDLSQAGFSDNVRVYRDRPIRQAFGFVDVPFPYECSAHIAPSSLCAEASRIVSFHLWRSSRNRRLCFLARRIATFVPPADVLSPFLVSRLLLPLLIAHDALIVTARRL
jgi:hypothetical protein